MNLRIEPTRKAKDLLWKLEHIKAFRDQFESATEFIEFSLEAAWDFYAKHPFKEIGRYDIH